MERAEGEALRLERESEAECVAQEQVIDIICLSVVRFFQGDERQLLHSYRSTHNVSCLFSKHVVNVLY